MENKRTVLKVVLLILMIWRKLKQRGADTLEKLSDENMRDGPSV